MRFALIVFAVFVVAPAVAGVSFAMWLDHTERRAARTRHPSDDRPNWPNQ